MQDMMTVDEGDRDVKDGKYRWEGYAGYEGCIGYNTAKTNTKNSHYTVVAFV